MEILMRSISTGFEGMRVRVRELDAKAQPAGLEGSVGDRRTRTEKTQQMRDEARALAEQARSEAREREMNTDEVRRDVVEEIGKVGGWLGGLTAASMSGWEQSQADSYESVLHGILMCRRTVGVLGGFSRDSRKRTLRRAQTNFGPAWGGGGGLGSVQDGVGRCSRQGFGAQERSGL